MIEYFTCWHAATGSNKSIHIYECRSVLNEIITKTKTKLANLGQHIHLITKLTANTHKIDKSHRIESCSIGKFLLQVGLCLMLIVAREVIILLEHVVF